MKLPAKVIYAYKAVTELALHYGRRDPVQIKEISEAQNIPRKFLVQILIRLKNAGIVTSARGVFGGYRLSKNPAHISLADVVRAIDESIVSVEPAMNSKGNANVDKIFGRIWRTINSDIVRQLETSTLDTIVSQLTREAVTYYI